MSQALEAAFKPAYANFRFPVECFNVGFTFEALLVAADGFKRAGTANGAELMKAIRATDIASHVMIGPPIKFDDKGQNVGIPSAVVQSRNRTPTVVLPAAAATMAPVLPMPGWQRRGEDCRDVIARESGRSGILRTSRGIAVQQGNVCGYWMPRLRGA